MTISFFKPTRVNVYKIAIASGIMLFVLGWAFHFDLFKVYGATFIAVPGLCELIVAARAKG